MQLVSNLNLPFTWKLEGDCRQNTVVLVVVTYRGFKAREGELDWFQTVFNVKAERAWEGFENDL